MSFLQLNYRLHSESRAVDLRQNPIIITECAEKGISYFFYGMKLRPNDICPPGSYSKDFFQDIWQQHLCRKHFLSLWLFKLIWGHSCSCKQENGSHCCESCPVREQMKNIQKEVVRALCSISLSGKSSSYSIWHKSKLQQEKNPHIPSSRKGSYVSADPSLCFGGLTA